MARTWVCLLPLAVLSAAADAAALPLIRIGVVVDGPWERNQEIRSQFQQEILELTRGEFDVRFPPEKDTEADWTVPGVRAAFERLLNDPEVDLILAMGVLASDIACHQRELPKPVFAPFVIDAETQGAPRQGEASGVHNLHYLSHGFTLRRDLELFREIAPFKHLTLLIDGQILDAFPGCRERIEQVVQSLPSGYTIVPVAQQAEPALAAIPAATDAVSIHPLLRLLPGEFDRLIAGLIVRGLPSFSIFGQSEVRRGVLAGLSEDIFGRRGRRVALSVQRALLGEDPGTFNVEIAEPQRLTINMATARAINVYPSFSLLTVAELVDEERKDFERKLNWERAAEEAVAANLDLAARERALRAGAQEIRRARSILLPQIEIAAQGAVIDADRAAATGRPERSLIPSAGWTQLIYAEPAYANLQIQRELQRARELDRESLRLDIVQQALTAYLQLLRAKTRERIQRDNLDVTRSNLELARSRQSIGFSGPADIYRWEAKIASDRSVVIDAVAERNLVEMALNRLLHRPLEEPFTTEEIGPEDPALAYIFERLSAYMSNPWRFDIFRDFMAQQGLERAPELGAIDRAIAAQQRALLSAKRAFFSPELFLQAQVEQLFKGGAGSSGLILPESTQSMFPDLFEPPNDTNWTVALTASLPLFTGGNRSATRDRDLEELARLALERQASAERIDQRIRSGLHQAGASHAGIALARDAAEAARNNLELVTDSYSRGVVSILDLLDAQNAALVAREAAANAVYDFLIDWMEVERSIGRFLLEASAAERREILRQADAFYRARGAAPPRPSKTEPAPTLPAEQD